LLPATMMMNAPANPDSRSNLSDPDEDFDYDKLMTHEMYDTRQPTIAGNYMVNAEVLAHQSIEHILDNVANILHEKYINSKLDGHTIESTYDLVELLFNTEFITYDHHQFADDADAEPPVVAIDNWGRSKIASKKVPRIEAHNEFNDHVESMLSEDRKALQRAKDIGKKLIKDAKGENMPAPLDLQEPMEIDKTEDDMRQAKERERKRQDEERAAEMQKRKIENQSKFKQGNADLKKKPFTYDYNGVPILIVNAKVEKFPPSAYLVQHAVQDPEVDNPKEKKKKPKELPPLKAKPKRGLDADPNPASKFGLGVPTFDLLEPQFGVVYIENGKTKNSNKTRFNLTSVTSGSLISTLSTNPNPKLTRSEYMQLTKGGNLSRSGLGDKDPLTAATVKSADDQKRSLLDPNAPKDQWTIKIGGVKESQFNTTGAMRMAQQYREAGAGEGVHYDPAKMEALLKASEEIRIESMQPPKQVKTMDKFTTDDSLKRSPVDTFNLELLNSKDWGKNTYAGHMNSLPKLPSHQKMQLEQSLGLKTKYPRYRATNIPMQKNYSELLLATLKSQQMA